MEVFQVSLGLFPFLVLYLGIVCVFKVNLSCEDLLTKRLRPFSGTRKDQVATKCDRMTANWSAPTPLKFQGGVTTSRVGRSATGCKDYSPTVGNLNQTTNGLDSSLIS